MTFGYTMLVFVEEIYTSSGLTIDHFFNAMNYFHLFFGMIIA